MQALYADLGHFNAKSIQLSFIAFVYPSLVVTYLGQTSYIMKNRQTASTAFWSSTPQSIAVPVIIIATLAAIIASQALITGAFSIMKQAISIKCFPRFTIKQTSNTNQVHQLICCINFLSFFQSIHNNGIAVVVGHKCVQNLHEYIHNEYIFVMSCIHKCRDKSTSPKSTGPS